MATTRAVVLAALIVCCGVTIAPAAMALDGGFADVGAVDSDDDSTDSIDSNDSTNSTDSTDSNDTRPMGAEVSAFMQSTAADSSASVDERMFVGAYESADEAEHEAVVVERIDRLEQRLEALEAERDELREREDELNPAAYEARMSRLAVRIDALERAVDDAEPRAEAAGVDPERLEELRNRTANVSGPAVAETAQGMAGVDPPAGPPEDAGERGDEASDDERGPPSDERDRRDADDERTGDPADDARDGQSDDGGAGQSPPAGEGEDG